MALAEINPLYKPAMRLITNILRSDGFENIGVTDGSGNFTGNLFALIDVPGIVIKNNQYIVVNNTVLTVVSAGLSGAQPLSSSDPISSGTIDVDTGDIVLTGLNLNTPVLYNLTSPTIVETSFAHNYVNDLVIRLVVPKGYGMVQANNMVGRIEVLTDTTFAIDVDTSAADPFVYPSLAVRNSLRRAAQAVPAGTFNNTTLGVFRNVLPFTGITS